MNLRFDRQTVVVTGAGQGIGRAIAHSFAAAGAQVWACDLNPEALEISAANAPTPLHSRVVDVTEREAVAALVSEAEAADRSAGGEGRVAVLVNNAGGVAGQVGRPLEEVSAEAWRVIFAVNVDAAFTFAQMVAPAMKRARSGRIINISSGAGLGVSLTGIQAYASAKAAQIGLTRQLAHELGPWGITVNSIAPGFVRSNPTTERQWQSYGEAGQQALLERIALRRLGTPQDIAHAVTFLASDLASWISGQTLSVDGGK
jgi:3-oxoacyl-[acyl-carrier protein] reductase